MSEIEFSSEDIGELYRKRWAIELLWKFLKMHLKLDKLMTKNVNGITRQIYSCLIVYIILQLTDVSTKIVKTTLDKLRYLQSFMNEKISYIHWRSKIEFYLVNRAERRNIITLNVKIYFDIQYFCVNT